MTEDGEDKAKKAALEFLFCMEVEPNKAAYATKTPSEIFDLLMLSNTGLNIDGTTELIPHYPQNSAELTLEMLHDTFYTLKAYERTIKDEDV